ncbi:MAG: hypothetical protein H5T75_08905 [Coriobacteriia bacterium]|nr:hypothetical protein [Coriobacteriia bacterium]
MRARGSSVIVTEALTAFLLGAGAATPIAAIATLLIVPGAVSPVAAGAIGAFVVVAVGTVDWLVLRPHLGARGSRHRWAWGLLAGVTAVLLTGVVTLASVTPLGPLIGGLAFGSFVGSVVALFRDIRSARKASHGIGLQSARARVVALLSLVLTQAGMLSWARATGGFPDHLFLMVGLPVSNGVALMLMAIIFQVLGLRVEDQGGRPDMADELLGPT